MKTSILAIAVLSTLSFNAMADTTANQANRNTDSINDIKLDNAERDQYNRDTFGSIQDRINNESSKNNARIDRMQDESLTGFSQSQSIQSDNSNRIDTIEDVIQAQGVEMMERLDGVKAATHAINNARPIPYSVGSFAVGVGVGSAGSKQALAIGGAYRMTENVSASFTVATESEGKFSKAEASAGAGVQLSF